MILTNLERQISRLRAENERLKGIIGERLLEYDNLYNNDAATGNACWCSPDDTCWPCRARQLIDEIEKADQ